MQAVQQLPAHIGRKPTHKHKRSLSRNGVTPVATFSLPALPQAATAAAASTPAAPAAAASHVSFPSTAAALSHPPSRPPPIRSSSPSFSLGFTPTPSAPPTPLQVGRRREEAPPLPSSVPGSPSWASTLSSSPPPPPLPPKRKGRNTGVATREETSRTAGADDVPAAAIPSAISHLASAAAAIPAPASSSPVDHSNDLDLDLDTDPDSALERQLEWDLAELDGGGDMLPLGDDEPASPTPPPPPPPRQQQQRLEAIGQGYGGDDRSASPAAYPPSHVSLPSTPIEQADAPSATESSPADWQAVAEQEQSQPSTSAVVATSPPSPDSPSSPSSQSAASIARSIPLHMLSFLQTVSPPLVDHGVGTGVDISPSKLSGATAAMPAAKEQGEEGEEAQAARSQATTAAEEEEDTDELQPLQASSSSPPRRRVSTRSATIANPLFFSSVTAASSSSASSSASSTAATADATPSSPLRGSHSHSLSNPLPSSSTHAQWREAQENRFWSTVEQIALGLKTQETVGTGSVGPPGSPSRRAMVAEPAALPLSPATHSPSSNTASHSHIHSHSHSHSLSFTAHVSSRLHELIHLHYGSIELEDRINSTAAQMDAHRAHQRHVVELIKDKVRRGWEERKLMERRQRREQKHEGQLLTRLARLLLPDEVVQDKSEDDEDQDEEEEDADEDADGFVEDAEDSEAEYAYEQEEEDAEEDGNFYSPPESDRWAADPSARSHHYPEMEYSAPPPKPFVASSTSAFSSVQPRRQAPQQHAYGNAHEPFMHHSQSVPSLRTAPPSYPSQRQPAAFHPPLPPSFSSTAAPAPHSSRRVPAPAASLSARRSTTSSRSRAVPDGSQSARSHRDTTSHRRQRSTGGSREPLSARGTHTEREKGATGSKSRTSISSRVSGASSVTAATKSSLARSAVPSSKPSVSSSSSSFHPPPPPPSSRHMPGMPAHKQPALATALATMHAQRERAQAQQMAQQQALARQRIQQQYYAQQQQQQQAPAAHPPTRILQPQPYRPVAMRHLSPPGSVPSSVSPPLSSSHHLPAQVAPAPASASSSSSQNASRPPRLRRVPLHERSASAMDVRELFGVQANGNASVSTGAGDGSHGARGRHTRSQPHHHASYSMSELPIPTPVQTPSPALPAKRENGGQRSARQASYPPTQQPGTSAASYSYSSSSRPPSHPPSSRSAASSSHSARSSTAPTGHAASGFSLRR